MNRFVLLGLGALALAACSKPEPADQAAPAPAPTEAPAASVPAPSSVDPALQAPSFDCAKAQSESEKLVCGDARLAALDRQLAEVYKRSQSSPDEVDIAAEQRGWAKGRDACWRAVDRHRCLVESYQTRLVELNLANSTVPAPAPVAFTCDDNRKPVSVVYYNELDPQAALIHWGKDQAIVFPAQAASGARYTREGVEFWEHQGEATLNFYGTALSCKAAG